MKFGTLPFPENQYGESHALVKITNTFSVFLYLFRQIS